MVHSLCGRIFSLLSSNNHHQCCRILGSDSDSEAQMVTVPRTCAPCDSRILVTNNNNYRVLSGEGKGDHGGLCRWSSAVNWTRTSPESLERVTSKTSAAICIRTLVGIFVVILVTVVIGLLVLYLRPTLEVQTITVRPISSSTVSPSTPAPRKHGSRVKSRHDPEYLKRVSRLTWSQLNKPNPSSEPQGNDLAEDGIVLPAKMVYTSATNTESSDPVKHSGRNCCRTQKYEQVIRREGCEPVTIVNRKCLGGCVSVWIPGIFGSFPVCSPSRTSWKKVTLVCGQNRDRRKTVQVERIKRCSCMEIESTTPRS